MSLLLRQPVSLCPGTQGDKPNNVFNGLKHVRTHEYVDQSLVDGVPPSQVVLKKSTYIEFVMLAVRSLSHSTE